MVSQSWFENRSNGPVRLSTVLCKDDVVIINHGENDITPVSTPEEIFRRIYGNVDNLYDNHYDSGVKSVFIAEILTRDDFTKCPGLTKTVFEKQMFSVNKKLAKKYK